MTIILLVIVVWLVLGPIALLVSGVCYEKSFNSRFYALLSLLMLIIGSPFVLFLTIDQKIRQWRHRNG